MGFEGFQWVVSKSWPIRNHKEPVKLSYLLRLQLLCSGENTNDKSYLPYFNHHTKWYDLIPLWKRKVWQISRLMRSKEATGSKFKILRQNEKSYLISVRALTLNWSQYLGVWQKTSLWVNSMILDPWKLHNFDFLKFMPGLYVRFANSVVQGERKGSIEGFHYTGDVSTYISKICNHPDSIWSLHRCSLLEKET